MIYESLEGARLDGMLNSQIGTGHNFPFSGKYHAWVIRPCQKQAERK